MAGWQLGSDPEIQVATVVSNHLTAGLLKYFGDAFRFDRVVNLFERLLPHQPEVAALLASAYIGMSSSIGLLPLLRKPNLTRDVQTRKSRRSK